MAFEGPERRKPVPGDKPRASFAELAAAALRTRLRETRDEGACWEHSPNLAWVRWPTEQGGFAFCALRRRFDFLTAEMGYSPVPVSLDDLPMVESIREAMPAGCRVRLGHVLQGYDHWWSSGGSEPSLVWRLDWLAHQLRFRLHSFLSAAAKID
jgi:hypothetical protein